MISHLLNIVYGIVFGVANIIPGVSGGTMMVVFGVYDKVVDVLTLKLSAIKKNIRFIVFFGIGAVIGILGFSFVITWLFDNFPVATNMFFMGLIIGSIPLIYRNMTVGGRKITPKCLFAFIPALALVVGMTYINKLPQNESFTVNAVHNATDCEAVKIVIDKYQNSQKNCAELRALSGLDMGSCPVTKCLGSTCLVHKCNYGSKNDKEYQYTYII